MTRPHKIGVIGPGNVGSFWARATLQAEHSLLLTGPSFENCPKDLQPFFSTLPLAENAKAWGQLDLIIVAVADHALAKICSELRSIIPEQGMRGPIVALMAGHLAPEFLISEGIPADKAIAAHPVFPFNSRHTSPRSDEVFHAVEGQPEAQVRMQKLIEAIGSRSFLMNRTNRTFYHLACVLASNHLVTLFHAAQQLLKVSCQDGKFPKEAILDLMEASVRNLRNTSPEEALTGPAKRGDTDALKEHLRHLSRSAPEYSQLYVELLRATKPLIPDENRDSIEEVIKSVNKSG